MVTSIQNYTGLYLGMANVGFGGEVFLAMGSEWIGAWIGEQIWQILMGCVGCVGCVLTFCLWRLALLAAQQAQEDWCLVKGRSYMPTSYRLHCFTGRTENGATDPNQSLPQNTIIMLCVSGLHDKISWPGPHINGFANAFDTDPLWRS